jgi:hypothetical protein
MFAGFAARPAGDIDLARRQIVRDVIALGLGDGPIKFYQHLSGGDGIAVLYMIAQDNLLRIRESRPE